MTLALCNLYIIRTLQAYNKFSCRYILYLTIVIWNGWGQDRHGIKSDISHQRVAGVAGHSCRGKWILNEFPDTVIILFRLHHHCRHHPHHLPGEWGRLIGTIHLCSSARQLDGGRFLHSGCTLAESGHIEGRSLRRLQREVSLEDLNSWTRKTDGDM